jgi:RNA polymerase sigma-70 factor, ECF subfamily
MEPTQQPAGGDVTALLRLWSDGDAQAFDRLIPLVYDELHRMALRYLAGERSSVSLQATALVNEVCLRLVGWDQARWQNRGHFFGVSAQMMRRVLVDIARRRLADRRGGAGAVRVPLDTVELPASERDIDLVAIDRALEKLAAEDARKARVVELRFFGGLSMEETAETLGISVRTAHSDWAFARAWLYRALSGESRV